VTTRRRSSSSQPARRVTAAARRAGPFAAVAGVLIAAALLAGPTAAGVRTNVLSAGLDRLLADLPAERVPTGILYDRVLPLSRIAELDGGPSSPPIGLREWLRVYDEIRRASAPGSSWPAPAELSGRAARSPRGTVPIALLELSYSRLRPEALVSGALVARDGRLALGADREADARDERGAAGGADGRGEGADAGDAFAVHRLFAAAPLRDRTYQGAEVVFRLDPENLFTGGAAGLELLSGDFDDGRGPTALRPGEPRVVRYATTGTKTIRLRAARPDGTEAEAAFFFEVRALRTPAPHDTLRVAATIPYQGGFASGSAYVYLADAHMELTDPVIVIEGFDLDNSMGWEELYELLNRQQLLETLRADGYDAVVLDFDDATDYIQRNAFVATALIEEVRARIEPGRTSALVGASMGGLIGRYALAYMETHDLEHAVRTFISFDAPQTGADIPLGLQYWLWFFADQSAEAAAWLAALDSPAARQLLLYHYTDPPGAAGEPDPLRAGLEADLAAVGGYPTLPRRVAVANGSGLQAGQGFQAGDQILRWEYDGFLVDIIGNVWAVPDQTNRTIFHGLIDFLFLPPDEAIVAVSGTRPADNAPGGWRDTMLDLDATEPGFGDIVALHPHHCFIPTVSALGLDTGDLFYDIAGDPEILERTPFDAVYFPAPNEEHVDITAANAAWLIAEIALGTGDAAGQAPPSRPLAWIAPPAPGPLGAARTIRYAVPVAGAARLTLHDAAGRAIALLAGGRHQAGVRELSWDGRAADGRRLESGVYFLRLRGDGFAAAARLTAVGE